MRNAAYARGKLLLSFCMIYYYNAEFNGLTTLRLQCTRKGRTALHTVQMLLFVWHKTIQCLDSEYTTVGTAESYTTVIIKIIIYVIYMFNCGRTTLFNLFSRFVNNSRLKHSVSSLVHKIKKINFQMLLGSKY